MNDNIEKEIILNRKIPSKIMTFTFSIFLLVISFIYISLNFNYKTYYELKGRYINGNVSLYVKEEEIKYILNNNKVE